VRANWENTVMRNEALNCHFFGDETDESISLMKTFLDDFEAFAGSLPALWGGRVTIGYMLFMEEYWMKDCIRATPDGRFSHDFFARGLTPSYLHKIDSISQVINSFNAIGESKAAANNVLNVTLPFGDLPLSAWEMLIRATAYGAISSLQINCTSKEELLDAIEHPENHQSLIVRVCGFSARFVSLPKHVQLDFIERNFYES